MPPWPGGRAGAATEQPFEIEQPIAHPVMCGREASVAASKSNVRPARASGIVLAVDQRSTLAGHRIDRAARVHAVGVERIRDVPLPCASEPDHRLDVWLYGPGPRSCSIAPQRDPGIVVADGCRCDHLKPPTRAGRAMTCAERSLGERECSARKRSGRRPAPDSAALTSAKSSRPIARRAVEGNQSVNGIAKIKEKGKTAHARRKKLNDRRRRKRSDFFIRRVAEAGGPSRLRGRRVASRQLVRKTTISAGRAAHAFESPYRAPGERPAVGNCEV